MKRLAFTLAEVLITLGIIGVVAALSIPTLMQKTNERETISKVKKNVKIFSDALEMAILEHGTLDKWGLVFDNLDSATLIVERLKPHLKIQKICETSSCEEYPIENFHVLSGRIYRTDEYNMNNSKKIILADGTTAIIRSMGGSIYIFIDVNGKNTPNTLGKDIFSILYGSNGKINYIQSTFGSDPHSTSWQSCNTKEPAQGWACTAWIMTYDNMDYLRCADDLYWNGPTRCP